MQNLQDAIKLYKATHPRVVKVNFDGELKSYPVEQKGLDIIEAQEIIIKELQLKV